MAGGSAGGVAGSVNGVGGGTLPGPSSGVAGAAGAGITCGAEDGGTVSGSGASAGFLHAERLIRAAAASRQGIFMMIPLQMATNGYKQGETGGMLNQKGGMPDQKLINAQQTLNRLVSRARLHGARHGICACGSCGSVSLNLLQDRPRFCSPFHLERRIDRRLME